MPLPSEVLEQRFPFIPTSGQRAFMHQLDSLLTGEADSPDVLLLNGYAGTGKTTLVTRLVNVLPIFNWKFLLLAPTGRAAKVMSLYAQKPAYTIHKIIYKHTGQAEEELRFSRQKNYYKNTVFIVDEASMLSNESDYGQNSLLKDLLEFIFEKESNKLVLVGDTAQLPPVGQTESPAMNMTCLQSVHHLKVREVELTQVLRQAQASGILENATLLRQLLTTGVYSPKLITRAFKDIFRMNADRLEDGLRYAYQKFGREHTIVICRSNKTAVMLNKYVRQQIHFMDEEINAGDILLVSKNNYVYFPEDVPGGFLANGDFVEITKIISTREAYGFRFADLELQMVDYQAGKFEAKVILDSLHTPSPSMSADDNRRLYAEVLNDYADMANKKEKAVALRKDPYLQALQIKFAYALTCHKAQGGQWKAVFIDQGYLKDDNVNQDWLRWLYTAITRATDEVFLINFDQRFFND